jgi:hypothetical protein
VRQESYAIVNQALVGALLNLMPAVGTGTCIALCCQHGVSFKGTMEHMNGRAFE